MDNPLVQVDPGLAIWTIVVFLVLLFLLKKFAWGPLLGHLEARRETIEKSLRDAQQARQELERLNRESSGILNRANAEAESILARSHADSEKLRKEMKQKAREEADVIIREARNQIEAETGNHIWSNKIDGAVSDLFELQDRMAAEVATKATDCSMMIGIRNWP